MLAMDDLRPSGTVEVRCRCGLSFWVDTLHPSLPMPANAACTRARQEFFKEHGRYPSEGPEILDVAEKAERYNRGGPFLCANCDPNTTFEKAL